MNERKPKPGGSHWTDEQWEAISARGASMLVAAAAGSGKTAVLVERIIRRIADEDEPLDVDRLLVATFTKAAAAEMRHRISEALEQALTASPGSEHLRRQLALMPRASITTLHSFCMEVIQRHHQIIGLEPGFRIVNETESALMRQDLLEELLEEHYGAAEENDGFWRLADTFSNDKSDDGLMRLIQRLYDDSRSHPWPERWLQEKAAMFAAGVLEEDHPWLQSLRASVELELKGLVAMLEEAVRIASAPGGPTPYLANLAADAAVVDELLRAIGEAAWDEAASAFQLAEFGRLKACKGDEYDKELQERVKALRTDVKDRLAALREELFARTLAEHERELTEAAPMMNALVGLIRQFAERYGEAKADKALVDFADLEHFCLRILNAPDAGAGELKPSPQALEYREQFAEVMLDEYQDTNRVQEAIVELISRSAPGNRFMVGDVKQSIYRFRLADPGLFQEKYRSYRTDGAEPGLRIDLARNFRSRREVVDGANYIFRQVMQETVGEIAYDAQAELIYGAGYPEEEAGGRHTLTAELNVIDRAPEDGEEGLDSAASGDSAAENGRLAADENGDEQPLAERELEAVQLEARLIGGRIREMLGLDGGPRLRVYDKAIKGMRDAGCRDIVILLRATSQWAPIMIEELKQMGIPGYAELNTGYFTATEVQVMLSLLKIIDNPYQDIPLASVLRSPIVGLGDDALAQIRVAGGSGPYFEAVRRCARERGPEHGDAETGDAFPAVAGDGLGGPEAERLVDAAQAPRVVGEPPFLSSESAETGAAPSADRPQQQPEAAGESVPSEAMAGDMDALRGTLERFLKQLKAWRRQAQQGSLADLIWDIYRQTDYFDFVGGLPGGQQRQANLRALYERARQYEATSFRGLFRFLRFAQRMQDSGGDLGTARALGEQEDVVRIMTIHKSKGLEFPVVFVAGLAKAFNRRDLTDALLLHKELGFGPRLLEPSTRVSYPSLPWLAIRRKIALETLAEEMRVLYVALTRAREKLILVSSVRGVRKLTASWTRYAQYEEPELPDDALARARCYLDWIGPALLRHPDGMALREAAGLPAEQGPGCFAAEPSRWHIRLLTPELFAGMSEAASGLARDDERLQSVLRQEPVNETERWEHEVWRRLSWQYEYARASEVLSKTSVTELKRLSEHHKLLERLSEEDAPGGELLTGDPGLHAAGAPGIADLARQLRADSSVQPLTAAGAAAGENRPAFAGEYRPLIVRRPRFLEQRKVSAAERGTVFHAVMQRIPLRGPVTEETVRDTLADMLERELLTGEQAALVEPDVIVSFFAGELGRRLLASPRVQREVPFSYRLPAQDVFGSSGESGALAGEAVMLQGVIDCVFEEAAGLVLLDYKTDRLKGASPERVAEGYRLQLQLYAEALEAILGRPVVRKYIFLFDGAHTIEL